MVTVGELLEALKDLDPNTIVVLDADPEGNNTHPAHGVGVTAALEIEYREMETFDLDDIEEYRADYDLPEDWQPVIVARIW